MTSTIIDTETENSTSSGEPDSPAEATTEGRNRKSTKEVRLSTVYTAVAAAVLIATVALFAALWFSARSDLRNRDAHATDDKHAEQIATDYAIGASTIDNKNLKAWFGRLGTGTTPQLAAKFDATAPQLEQILLPLQWTSNATPITAVVTSESGGVRKVSVFLNVTSTSAQTPQGSQTTVTYTVTVDKNADWKITEVGGLDAALRK
ncbi:hypothetical protein [Nocardia sp. NPDC050175]|uniref:hypothetical protein n=1 Tax=Nocardia sp. NPDC050175 TaxID=3364317 RepID=UPI0037BB877E